MSNQIHKSTEHEEIFAMLPWYVNESLEAQQSRAVLEHLESCTACQNEVGFLKEFNNCVQDNAQDKQSSHARLGANLESVMNRIDSDEPPVRFDNNGMQTFGQKIRDLFSFVTALPAYQLGATAMAGILVAVLSIHFISGQPDDEYSVLSSADVSATTLRLSAAKGKPVKIEDIQTIVDRELPRFKHSVRIETTDDTTFTLLFTDEIDIAVLGELVTTLQSDTLIDRIELVPQGK